MQHLLCILAGSEVRVVEPRTRRQGYGQAFGDTPRAFATLHRSRHRDADLHAQQKLAQGKGYPRSEPQLAPTPARAARKNLGSCTAGGDLFKNRTPSERGSRRTRKAGHPGKRGEKAEPPC